MNHKFFRINKLFRNKIKINLHNMVDFQCLKIRKCQDLEEIKMDTQIISKNLKKKCF